MHSVGLHRFALRLSGGIDADAEELTQEAWVRAVRGLDRYEGRGRFRSWLYAIATRCASELYRKRKRGDRDTTTLEVGAVDGSPTSRMDLERAFAALPFGFRSVLVLHDVEGYRHREIAQLLGISPGTSKSQLSRARARVRALLGEEYAGT